MHLREGGMSRGCGIHRCRCIYMPRVVRDNHSRKRAPGILRLPDARPKLIFIPERSLLLGGTALQPANTSGRPTHPRARLRPLLLENRKGNPGASQESPLSCFVSDPKIKKVGGQGIVLRTCQVEIGRRCALRAKQCPPYLAQESCCRTGGAATFYRG